MWIFLGILLFLACVITVILLLPVYIIIRSDEEDSLYLRYKFLHRTYGENPDPNDPIIKALKSASGIARLEKGAIRKSLRENQLLKTLREEFTLVVDLLKELLGLLKGSKAKIFRLKIVCADTNAADAAIKYGQCSAAVYPLLGYLRSNIQIRPKGEDIQISCDFHSNNSEFAFETILVIRVYRVLGALLRTAFAEAKRQSTENSTQGTQRSSDK